MQKDLPDRPSNRRLTSWKEIAAFFERDERTVRRWEKERSLPVHRLPGGSRGSVFAYADELSAWLHSAASRPGINDVSEIAPAIATVPSPLALPSVSADAPPRSTPSSWPRRALAIGSMIALIGLLGFFRVFQIRSVHGHVLPVVGIRRDVAAHHQAEEFYLQGRYHWSKRTGEDLTQAADDFNKAIQLDPNYALGYAGLADTYNLLREYTSMPAGQAFPLAIAAARKALALDDSLPEAHRALAFASFHWNWDVPGGEREFQRAIALSPNDAQSHHWYATALMALGRYPQAIEEIERARQLDPSSSSIAADRAVTCSSRRAVPRKASPRCNSWKLADPQFLSPHQYLAQFYLRDRQYAKFLAESETVATLSHDDHALQEARTAQRLLATSGPAVMMHARLAQQIADFQQGRDTALSVAETYALLGQKRDAVAYLEKAYQRHEYSLLYLHSFRVFDILQDDPEFQDLSRRLNL